MSLVLLLTLIFTSDASAQVIKLTTDTTLFTIHQESIPAAADSGGRWIPVNIVVTSHSDYPIHIPGFSTHVRDYLNPGCAPFRRVKLADSAWSYADSIFIGEDVLIGNTMELGWPVAHSAPWKYKDSVMALWRTQVDTEGHSIVTIDGNAYHGSAVLEYVVPPHGTVRVPYLVQSIGDENTHQLDVAPLIFDIQMRKGIEYWFSDSAGIRRMGDSGEYELQPYPYWLSVLVPATCSAPARLFDTATLTNKTNSVVLGSGTSFSWSKWTTSNYDTLIQRTNVSFRLVGEYADRFDLPADVILDCGPMSGGTLRFNGAPKPIVHDTLIATSINCWGSVVTRTPIEAYSTIKNGYKVRALQTNTVPFLGSTYDTLVLSNVSDFSIELKDLQLYKFSNDPESFQFVSSPSVIAAHDSGYIVLLLTDNNNAKDTANDYRSAYVTGVVTPYQVDMAFSDSVILAQVSGKVDVFCPVNTIYTGEKPPKLQHGIHPTGIIFPSDVTSTITGPRSFEVRFGNFDSVSEYFYLPYFDDPRFQITLGNWDGFGTLPVPGSISPAQFSSQICAKISYTGDDNHNYLTQLHWPRAKDTVTIDVMAIGVDAPPFSGVAVQSSSSAFLIWPNPASSVIHIGAEGEDASFTIYDIVGREVYSGEVLSNETFDISTLSPGFYSVVLSSRTDHPITEKLSIVR